MNSVARTYEFCFEEPVVVSNEGLKRLSLSAWSRFGGFEYIMKFMGQISLLIDDLELNLVLSKVLNWALSDDCPDELELADGHCNSPCQPTMTAGFDAEANCLLPSTSGVWGYLVLLSSAFIWVYVLLRLSVGKAPKDYKNIKIVKK